MRNSIEKFKISEDRVFSDVERCLEVSKPDVVILCPSTARHAEYVERVAGHGVHVLVEKPFASTLAEADRMISAMSKTGKQLVINWPLRWYPCHVTAKRMVDEGHLGQLLQVHYYDGNRGPLRHGAGKVEKEPQKKAESWFYQKAEGGGSLQDYLGYGVTLGTWYHDGRKPIEVTAMVDQPAGLEVDEQSVTVARYESGLSKFETRWGTFTDPWAHQPQPGCGFVLVGDKGTLSSYDYQTFITLQTEERPEPTRVPVDKLEPPFNNPIQYLIKCLDAGEEVDGPLSPRISRIGQQIIESAVLSIREKRTVALVE